MLRVTTPLFYVNSKPHIGHLYSILYADAIKIWKSQYMPVQLLTGTDEHGQKIQIQAQTQNIETKKFCNNIQIHYRYLLQQYNIKPDIFIRTTDQVHMSFVQDQFSKLVKKQKIKTGEYEGWYCQNEESFITLNDVSPEGLCPSGHKLQQVTETNHFLELESVKSYLFDLINLRGDKYIKELSIELENMKSQGICLTRPKSRVQWGINIPQLSDHVIYVWFDALLGYLTQIPNDQDIQFHHVLGKDILKFHHIHLSLILKQLGIKHEANFTIHHHWIVEGRKMSKSLNNVICPIDLLKNFDFSAIRLMFLAKGPQNSDISFSNTEIIKTYNDYINSFQNSLYRILNKKLWNQSKVSFFKTDFNLQEFEFQTVNVKKRLDDNDFVNGYNEIRKLFFILNQFINQNAPWNETDQIKKNQIIASTMVQIRVLMYYLKAFIPDEIISLKNFTGEPLMSIPDHIEISNSDLDPTLLLRKKYK